MAILKQIISSDSLQIIPVHVFLLFQTVLLIWVVQASSFFWFGPKLWSKKILCLFVHLLKLLPGYSVKSLSCNWPLKPQFSQQCLEWDGIYQNTNLWQTIMKRSVIKLKYNSSNSPYNTSTACIYVFHTQCKEKEHFFLQNSASCKTQSVMGQQLLSGTLNIHSEVVPSFSVLPFPPSLMTVLSFEALLATRWQCAIYTLLRNSSPCDLTDHCRRHSGTWESDIGYNKMMRNSMQHIKHNHFKIHVFYWQQKAALSREVTCS